MARWENNLQKRNTPCIASPYIFTYIIAGKGFLWNSGVPRGWVLVGLAWCASERKDGISVSGEEKGAKGREKEWRDAENGSEAAQMMKEWKETGFSAVKACFSPFFSPLLIAYIFSCSGKHSSWKMRLIVTFHVAINPACPLETFAAMKPLRFDFAKNFLSR